MAGLALRLLTADNTQADLPLTFTTLPAVEGGKKGPAQDIRREARNRNTVRVELPTTTPWRLFLFPDMSAVIATQTTNGWTAVPEVFALNGSVHTPVISENPSRMHTLQVFPGDGQHVHLKGETYLIDAWPQALQTTMQAWADHFSTLAPAQDPRYSQTGLWPSFAAVPAIPEAKLLKARGLTALMAKYVAQTLGLPTVTVHVEGIRLDQPNGKKPTLHFYQHQSTGPYKPDLAKAMMAWQKTLQDALLHPDFPLQGREWIVPAMVDNKQNNKPKPIMSFVLHDLDISAHGLMEATSKLMTLAPNMFEALHG
jgi:hypothetical protein